MTSSILNQAAQVIRLTETGTAADAALRETLGRTRHSSEPIARRAISRAVFCYFRWLRWLEPKESLQKQVAAALDLQARFDCNPVSIKPETLAIRAVPEWILDEIAWPEVGAVAPNGPRALEGKRSYPSEAAWLRQLQRDPVLWIRAKAEQAAKVAAALGDCTPAEPSALCASRSAFRYTGTRDLFLTPEFKAGMFEIQDLASQLVGHACTPKPGETWWDACAGEGGKTLHLADLMHNRGLIWASDRSLRRLAKLKERAARAQVFNYRTAAWDGGPRLPTKTKFDGVLIDAPCSGIGTWQRNPHARWTTQPKDVRELAAVQQRLLAHVAPAVKPGGRLVYAVCTLTRSETTAVAAAFTAVHPDFESMPLSSLSTGHSSLLVWPHEHNCNGMFIAAWRKK